VGVSPHVESTFKTIPLQSGTRAPGIWGKEKKMKVFMKISWWILWVPVRALMFTLRMLSKAL